MTQALTKGSIHLGRAVHNQPVYWDLQHPHLGLSMVTGRGKSTFCRGVAAQFLHKGGRVVIIDSAKSGDSHGDWVLDGNGLLIPGVELAITDDEAHNLLVSWDTERLRRARASFRKDGDPPQRTLVIVEELNITIDNLRDHWRSIKASGDSIVSPAVRAIKGLSCAGRSARVHLLLVAQELGPAAAGGGAIFANLEYKVLAGCDQRTWKRLTSLPWPKSGLSERPGDAVLLMGSALTEFHINAFAAGEARQYATEGEPQPVGAAALEGTDEAGGVAEQVPVATPMRSENTLLTPSATQSPDDPVLPPETVTLSDAIKLGVLPGMDLKALQNYRDRHPHFPSHIGTGLRGAKRYSTADLWLWHESQLRA